MHAEFVIIVSDCFECLFVANTILSFVISKSYFIFPGNKQFQHTDRNRFFIFNHRSMKSFEGKS